MIKGHRSSYVSKRKVVRIGTGSMRSRAGIGGTQGWDWPILVEDTGRRRKAAAKKRRSTVTSKMRSTSSRGKKATARRTSTSSVRRTRSRAAMSRKK